MSFGQSLFGASSSTPQTGISTLKRQNATVASVSDSTPKAGGSIFGSTSTAAPSTGTNSLIGGAPPTNTQSTTTAAPGGLFGGSVAPSTPPAPTSLISVGPLSSQPTNPNPLGAT